MHAGAQISAEFEPKGDYTRQWSVSSTDVRRVFVGVETSATLSTSMSKKKTEKPVPVRREGAKKDMEERCLVRVYIF